MLLTVGGATDHLRCEAHLEIIPRATHLFEERGARDRVAALAHDWFATHLQRASAVFITCR